VRKLTILHSNDLHARLLPDDRQQGGWAYLATLVRQQKAGCKECLYLNAGDLVQGTPVSTLFQGLPLYDIGNRLGFDASTLGNHEFDYGFAQVPRFLRMAKFPVVSANVVNERGEMLAPRAYVIKKVNGIRVGIIGMAMGNLVEGFLTPRTAGPWKALNVSDTAKRYAAELRGKADLIVVLGHINQKEGSALLVDAPDVDVVVEGHSHAGRREMERVGDRVAVGCRGYGVELCRLDLEVSMPEGKVVTARWTKLPVDSKTIAPANDLAKRIARWEREVAKVVDVKIAVAERDFLQPELQGLIEKAMKEEMQADFSFMNRGGIRDRLPKGPVLARHIWNIMPFDNRMMTARVKGSQLGKFLKEGETVEPDKEYTLALFDYLVDNAESRESLGLAGMKFEDRGLLLRDMMIRWVEKQKVLR
jgi:5'-nucleotidase / UDP-sugar diphosphatase